MARNPAILRSTMPPGLVIFDLNPEQVQMSRNAVLGVRGNASPNGGFPAGATGSIFKRAAGATIRLNKVIFYGGDVKTRCDQLLNWMSPGGGLLGQLAGAALSAATGGAVNLLSRPPLVTFQWGPPVLGFMYDVIINGVTIRYHRFSDDGTPVRADVDIQMQEQPSLFASMPTNPTSGGLPGRRAHTVTAGESLPGIATGQYGSPGYWRRIAECNGIEDPLRVRPGDRVYLPNPDELRGGER